MNKGGNMKATFYIDTAENMAKWEASKNCPIPESLRDIIKPIPEPKKITVNLYEKSK